MKNRKVSIIIAMISLTVMLAGCGSAGAGEVLAAGGNEASQVTEDTQSTDTADEVDPVEDYSPEAEVERLKEVNTYMGGLYISEPDNDLQFSIFRNENGDLVFIVTKLEDVYYGIIDETTDAVTEDGRPYTKFTLEDTSFGYHFEADQVDAFMVDEDGAVYKAKELDESAAWDMVLRTLGG